MDDREGRIAAASDRVEKGLQLLGATAVEDKLQVGGREGWGGRRAVRPQSV
jgi:magnesium-transporting ATPase (P-type)